MFASLTRSPSDPAIWRWWLLSLRLPPTDGVSPAGGARCVRSTALRPPDQTGAAHHRPRSEAVEQQRQSIHALADDRRSHGRLRRPSRTAGGAARCGRDRDHPHPGQPAPEVRGAGRSAKLVRAKKAIKAMGLQIATEIPVNDAARLARLLQRSGPSPMIVAAGGDGTVGAVADAIVGTPAVLGIIPLGTSNDFARSISVPMHLERAVQLLARGRISRVDAGRFTGEGERPRHFVHAAAVGLKVAFARFATRDDVRARLGRLTSAAAA